MGWRPLQGQGSEGACLPATKPWSWSRLSPLGRGTHFKICSKVPYTWYWSCIHLRHLWKFVTKSEGGGKDREANFLGLLLRPERTPKHVFLFHLFLAVLGLCCCTDFSLVVLSGGYSGCSARAAHCGGSSCRGARALRSSSLSSCGSRALEHRFNTCGACT